MTESLGGNAKEQLKGFIDRIEAVEEEKKARADDIRDLYKEAKGAGIDGKALRAIIRRRKDTRTDPEKLKAHEALVETYMEALGPYVDTPLGAAAIKNLKRVQ